MTVSSRSFASVVRTFIFVLIVGIVAAPETKSFGQTAATANSGQASTPEAQSPEANRPEDEVNESDTYRHSKMVTALGAKVGWNAEQAATAFEIANFIVLIAAIGFFLIKALPKTFRNRTTLIQRRLVDARMATEEATARMNSVEDRLGRLDAEIFAMREQAETDAVAEERRFADALEQEKGRLLSAAEQEISIATMQARRQIQQFAADLAIDQAAKKLVVTAETDRLLVQSFARRLTSGDEKGGQN